MQTALKPILWHLYDLAYPNTWDCFGFDMFSNGSEKRLNYSIMGAIHQKSFTFHEINLLAKKYKRRLFILKPRKKERIAQWRILNGDLFTASIGEIFIQSGWRKTRRLPEKAFIGNCNQLLHRMVSSDIQLWPRSLVDKIFGRTLAQLVPSVRQNFIKILIEQCDKGWIQQYESHTGFYESREPMMKHIGNYLKTYWLK
jgi:hypothetical protein